jgi:catechol-2,3-dioxygenase
LTLRFEVARGTNQSNLAAAEANLHNGTALDETASFSFLPGCALIGTTMFEIKRLNHAVLYVRDAERVARFYQDVLGFVVATHRGNAAYFLRANASTDNNHDLGLFSIGPNAPAPTRGERVGLYHLAWQVDSLPELVIVRDALLRANALVGVNDHGSSLSLYAQDPDGNEFEVFWMVPQEEWETRSGGNLDIEGEMRKRGMMPIEE